MKTYLARAAVASMLLLGASTPEAQWTSEREDGLRKGQTLYGINWEVSAPIGDFKDFISDWSFRGFSAEARYMMTDRLSLGTAFSWNRWSETNLNGRIDVPNGNITGPVYRYADAFGIKLLAHYYLMSGPIQPYVGAGIGGAWSFSFQQAADLANSHDSFDFLVAPEIGVMWQVMRGNRNLHLNVALRYTFTTASLPNKNTDIQWLTLPVVGLAWSY